MDIPKIIQLREFRPIPSVSIKLNNDVVSHFKTLLAKNEKPKLIVKDGNISIKINDNLTFPCAQIPEYSNLDIYSLDSDTVSDYGPAKNNTSYNFGGRIKTKLSVVTGSKQIKDFENSLKNSTTSQSPKIDNKKLMSNHITSSPATPLNFDPYLVVPSDSKSDRQLKFLTFLALGPTTKTRFIKLLKFNESELNEFISTFAQIYNSNDTFLVDDIYPSHPSASKINLGESNEPQPEYILKDKSYKELRPWKWKYYSPNERSSILNNIHNALTRSGYLDTHPLRRKICESNEDSEPTSDIEKRPNLGGGLLISKKSPFKKSHTESPRLGPTTLSPQGLSLTPLGLTLSLGPAPTAGPSSLSKNTTHSPVRTLKLSKKRQLSNNSTSSSDDEIKRYKKEEYTSPSSINEDDYEEGAEDDDDGLDKSKKHYHNLTIKFRLKYKEYETLYNSMSIRKPNEVKKSITKLFELHQTLSDWKKQLWKFNDDLKLKSDIMNLSKHKNEHKNEGTKKDPKKPNPQDSLALKRASKPIKQGLNY